jgi:hypothetical protein
LEPKFSLNFGEVAAEGAPHPAAVPAAAAAADIIFILMPLLFFPVRKRLSWALAALHRRPEETVHLVDWFSHMVAEQAPQRVEVAEVAWEALVTAHRHHPEERVEIKEVERVEQPGGRQHPEPSMGVVEGVAPPPQVQL